MKIFLQTFSKILGFLFAILFFVFILTLLSNFMEKKENSNFSHLKGDSNSSEIIAILNLKGPIISNPKESFNYNFYKTLDSIHPSLINDYLKELENKKILGLIISIDSPGGSVAATQIIYKQLNEFKKANKIPIYFHTNNILASGAYWISLASNKIYANYGALIGSIGVKGPDWLYYNSPTAISSGLLGQSIESPNGIELFSNLAGTSKDIYNPFRKPTNKEIKQLKAMVDGIYTDFKNLVSASRKIEPDFIKNEIGAMIYSHRQAKKLFLIDDYKNIEEVIDILSEELNLKSKNIISNKKNKKYRMLGLNFYNKIFRLNLKEEYNKEVEKNFCSNLINQISVVSVTINFSSCYRF